MQFPQECDADFFAELTAETYADYEDAGQTKRGWIRVKGRANEALDIAVGARALAYHFGVAEMEPADWVRLRADRMAPPSAGDLFAPASVGAAIAEADDVEATVIAVEDSTDDSATESDPMAALLASLRRQAAQDGITRR